MLFDAVLTFLQQVTGEEYLHSPVHNCKCKKQKIKSSDSDMSTVILIISLTLIVINGKNNGVESAKKDVHIGRETVYLSNNTYFNILLFLLRKSISFNIYILNGFMPNGL